MATFDGWVNSVHYNITAKVGDLGAVFAADRCAPLLPSPLLSPTVFVYASTPCGRLFDSRQHLHPLRESKVTGLLKHARP
jgi:hypothetical protein